MPLPEPRTGENQDEFISRCLEEVSGEFDDQDQALAVCFNQWREDSASVVPISSHPGFTKFRAADSTAAEILIYEDVGGLFGGISAVDFAKQLSELGAVKEINVRLNSPGGSVFDGLAKRRNIIRHNKGLPRKDFWNPPHIGCNDRQLGGDGFQGDIGK